MAVSYRNWRGRASRCRTRRWPRSRPRSARRAAARRTADPAGAAVAPFPARRSWGFAVQLYSVRSRASWGHGDLHDLADLAAWSGGELGADFVLVNPLHAAEPQPPVSPSPYLPMTRRQISPLYLRIEDIPEYQGLSAGDRAAGGGPAAPLRAASSTAALIDRDAVWGAKRAALELIRAVPLTTSRRAALDAFLARDRRAVEDWATWCAIAEVHGPDWRSWPTALADPASAEVTELRQKLADTDRVPRLAAVAGGGAAGRGAAGGPAGRHEHRRDHRSRGRRASRRRRRLGPPGRHRARHQRGRAAGRVQPARSELDAAAVAPGPARRPGGPAAGRADRGVQPQLRRPAGGPRHGTGPAVVDTGRNVPGTGHLRAVRPRTDGRRAGRRGGRRGRAGDRRGSRHGRALAAEVPGRAPDTRHLHAVVRAAGGRHPAQARRVAPRLPGHGGHARHAAGRGVPHRRAGHHPGRAWPARPSRRPTSGPRPKRR